MRVSKPALMLVAAGVVVALVVAALVPAAASRIPFSTTVPLAGVQVAPQHVGDAMRYERAWTLDGEALASEALVTLGSPSTAVDAYGIERAVDMVTVAIRGDAGDADYLCSFTPGSTELVRRDTIAGSHFVMYSGTWEGIPFTDQYTREAQQTLALTTSFEDTCTGRHTLGGETLRAGQEITLVQALGGAITLPDLDMELRAAGVESTWEGRDALTFTFQQEDARVVATWADGLPGVARIEVRDTPALDERGWFDGGAEEPFTMTLRGFEIGAGPELAAAATRALPERHPSAPFVATPKLTVDDSAFALTYPYGEAIAGLRADPLTCAREMLARSDAVVLRAEWDRDARDYLAPGATTLGGWSLQIVAGGEFCSAYTVRLATHALLPPVTRNYDEEGPIPIISPTDEAPVLPDEVADADALAALMALGGVDPADARNIVWTVLTLDDAPTLHVRVGELGSNPPEAGEFESDAVDLDAGKGALLRMMAAETTVTESPLPLGETAGSIEMERSVLGALGGPFRGQGLAIAGIAGLALIAKVLFGALYSRLQRATLLDNPVRANLYDAVRRDPGVHRAALIEFAGVGVGATTRHLRQLVAHRYLVEVSDGGFARYYAAGEVPPVIARQEATLRGGSRREVYELFRAEPSLTLREAGARLGMSAPSVYRAKARLEKEGLLPAAPESSVQVTVDA